MNLVYTEVNRAKMSNTLRGGETVAKGSMPRREAKKPKKAESKRPMVSVPIASGEATEVVGKKRKKKNE